MALSENTFGNLVKSYREQRGWSQDDLASRWGYSRTYVSQIEKGKRKLDSITQVMRLADILDIPQEKLESIGRGIPQRKLPVVTPKDADNAILQILLAQGRDKVRLSYMVWLADHHPLIEEDLKSLVSSLDTALTSHYGDLVRPAQQILAYAHQMQGRMAFDRLDFALAGGHFSEMISLGQELHDPDIITLGMAYQADVLRKRGRYETALRCFEAAKPYADIASKNIQGKYLAIIARAHYLFGNEDQFLASINASLEIASDMQDSISSLANQFSLDEVLCEEAAGFTRLGKPEEAIDIFKKTDQLRPFRPMREQGSYTLEKSLAHLYMGDLDEGIKYALKGLELAVEYQSNRHIQRMDGTYQRLQLMPIGKDMRLNTLHDALVETKQKQEAW